MQNILHLVDLTNCYTKPKKNIFGGESFVGAIVDGVLQSGFTTWVTTDYIAIDSSEYYSLSKDSEPFLRSTSSYYDNNKNKRWRFCNRYRCKYR